MGPTKESRVFFTKNKDLYLHKCINVRSKDFKKRSRAEADFDLRRKGGGGDAAAAERSHGH